MGKYQRLLEEYHEMIICCDESEDNCPTIITKIYPKEVNVKTNRDGLPYLEYYGYCGTNKGLKSIYIPCIDMEIESFYCGKETTRSDDSSPDFEPNEYEYEDGADSYSTTTSFTPDFDGAALSTSCEITKWFYGFNFQTDKMRASEESKMFFTLVELTADDVEELGLGED